MKFLGIELSDYAGIERQFVPMDSALRLLVGKNNSGKSATLLYLNAGRDRSKLSGYVDNDSVEYRVYYAIEQSDKAFERHQYPINEMATDRAVLRFTFNLQLSDANGLRFVDCYLVSPRYKEPMLLRDSKRSEFRFILDESEEDEEALSEKIGEALSKLENPVYLAPHRTITGSVPMKSMMQFPSDGEDLPTFLQTLNNENRDAFEEIEKSFCRLFPEFDRIVLRGKNSEVGIALRHKEDASEISITRCGNGLEQALIVLTSLFGADKKSIILFDEPHNFLHPGAERVLLHILRDADRQIIAATHSPIFINGVSSGQVTLISKPGESFEEYWEREAGIPAEVVLDDIGFKNSDSLFHDALVFVEGPSDAEILPILLRKLNIDDDTISSLGFPVLKGVAEMRNAEKVSGALSLYENLLKSLGKRQQKHIYYFDGDRDFLAAAVNRVQIDGRQIPLKFSPHKEMENNLLNHSAIASALRLQAIRDQADGFIVTDEEIADQITTYSGSDAKGSDILSCIFTSHQLTYDKRKSGRLIAENMPANDPLIRELCQPILDLLHS